MEVLLLLVLLLLMGQLFQVKLVHPYPILFATSSPC
eukprot:Nitzschia sp. Nitz4//scaffold30_size153850//67//195//NITZ4_002753-RA/size153850-exonerate_est2genome-gene-0.229-mRNA-1//1//CDS//3329547187//6993//frame0